MPDPAIAQVEDALKAALEAYAALAGFTVLTEQSGDIVITAEQYPAIAIYTIALAFEEPPEQWQTLHTATVEFEIATGTQASGTISRANHTTVAHIIGCIAADRSLGGLVEDIQEIDVAPSSANGRDVGSISLQCRVQFFTSRDDWFTLV